MIVGLTGGIASGKSESAKYFEQLGAYCIDADAVSKKLTAEGSPLLKKLTDIFGYDILFQDGALNRRKLADIIFSDSGAKLKVESILHVRIIACINKIILREIRRRNMIIINAPLLFETGLDKICDKIIVVKVPYNIQVCRLSLRDGLNDNEIEKRISSQMPADEAAGLADFVIDNSGSKEDLKKKIEDVYKLLLAG
ncbi:MAG: dephospho-CoA kinase [Endomicrobium sp.]|jgi:dephospho-CoA kinase|nr:dephospho-CoA kinase [Endomicrobium sp.]